MLALAVARGGQVILIQAASYSPGSRVCLLHHLRTHRRAQHQRQVHLMHIPPCRLCARGSQDTESADSRNSLGVSWLLDLGFTGGEQGPRKPQRRSTRPGTPRPGIVEPLQSQAMAEGPGKENCSLEGTCLLHKAGLSSSTSLHACPHAQIHPLTL